MTKAIKRTAPGNILEAFDNVNNSSANKGRKLPKKQKVKISPANGARRVNLNKPNTPANPHKGGSA